MTPLVHPVWDRRALGASARRIWEYLAENHGAGQAAVRRGTGLSRNTTRTHLRRLVDHRLIDNDGGGYRVRNDADLDAVADEYGVAHANDERAERFDRERGAYLLAQKQLKAGTYVSKRAVIESTEALWPDPDLSVGDYCIEVPPWELTGVQSDWPDPFEEVAATQIV